MREWIHYVRLGDDDRKQYASDILHNSEEPWDEAVQIFDAEGIGVSGRIIEVFGPFELGPCKRFKVKEADEKAGRFYELTQVVS